MSNWSTQLLALHCADATAEVKYNALARFFFGLIDEATERAPLNFAGPFAKTDYLLTEAGADPGLALAVNGARARFRKRATMSAEEISRSFADDFRAVAEFAALINKVDLPKEIRQLFPAPVYRQAIRETQTERPEYIRAIAERTDDTYLYLKADSPECQPLRLNCRRNGREYLLDIVGPRDQVNLIAPTDAEGDIDCELVIYNPDYLINASQIASCFESYATDARLAIVRKFMPPANTAAINLGNFASQLLDEEIHSDPATRSDLASSAASFFRSNAVNIATCDIPPTFRAEAAAQQVNIHNAIQSAMPRHVGGFDREKVMLEPAFFSEMLGLQGRMDMMQLDYRVVVEQKSGKGAYPQGDFSVPRHTQAHYVQLLLYMAIMRYNYRERYIANGQRLTSFLLYSRYSQPLLGLGAAPELLREAMEVRNMLVHYEQRLAEGDISFLHDLTPENLAPQAQGKLWEMYVRPQLAAVLNPLHGHDTLAQSYFWRMLRFVATEHMLAKTGGKSKPASGFASAWHSSTAEKLEAGNIYTRLYMIHPGADHNGRVENLELAFSESDDNEMANFRSGDAVLLYPYAPGAEPDARRTMVFRCTITKIGSDRISLALRFVQSSARPFADASDMLWAIEHDFMDSSHNSLYQGLHAFLTAPERRRDLLLLRRSPRVDKSAVTKCEHEAFASLAKRVKQASELFLIIGPPGTGKTSFGLVSTLREQLAEEGSSILLLSYTNRAVDEICSKLVDCGLDFMRVGPALSCAPEFRPYLLGPHTAGCKNVGQLRRAIADTRIFTGTVSALNASINLLKLKTFDLAIIDEASQILEPHLLPLLSAKSVDGGCAIRKIVMIGDHKQLPAVVQQTQAESAVSEPELNEAGLTDCRLSLFERLLRRYGSDPAVTYMLTRQGRMHTDIAEFPNLAFYNGRLGCAGLPHQLGPLPPCKAEDLPDRIIAEHRMAFVDIAEAPTLTGSDKVNRAEAGIISSLAAAIYRKEEQFSAEDTLGIIVPYRNQIAAIRSLIADTGIPQLTDITVDTVERFQGSQRKYIIYGFTVKRENQLKFLTEHTFTDIDGSEIDRKLNVAMTRAREHMIFVGNSGLLSSVPTFGRLIDHIRSHGGIYSMPR